jgi:hypothetical protein
MSRQVSLTGGGLKAVAVSEPSESWDLGLLVPLRIPTPEYTPYTLVVYMVYMAKTSTAGKIVAAAAKLLDREGATAVTMRRVAKGVGITPMALYRHFADRDGLLNALADIGFEELAARAGDINNVQLPFFIGDCHRCRR